MDPFLSGASHENREILQQEKLHPQSPLVVQGLQRTSFLASRSEQPESKIAFPLSEVPLE